MFGREKKLMRDGAEAQGVVTKFQLIDGFTPHSMDRVLEIQVKLADGRTVEFKDRIAETHAPWLVTGSPIPVRYDPDDPDHITIDKPAVEALKAKEDAAAAAEDAERIARTQAEIADGQ